MQQKEIIICIGLFVISYGVYCYLGRLLVTATIENTSETERNSAIADMVSINNGRSEAMYSLLGGLTAIFGALILL